MLIAKHEGSGSNVTQAGGVGIYMVSDEEPGGGLASSDAIRYLQEDQQNPIVELIINQQAPPSFVLRSKSMIRNVYSGKN